MEKKNFVEPTFDLIVLNSEDVVRTSAEDNGGIGDYTGFKHAGLFEDESEE